MLIAADYKTDCYKEFRLVGQISILKEFVILVIKIN